MTRLWNQREKSVFIDKCRDMNSSKHRKYLLLCLTKETTESPLPL